MNQTAAKRKFTVADDAFKTETYSHYNGAIVTEAVDKEGVQQEGRSGTTKAYDTAQGGRLFLHDDQVTLIG
jgi:hypothetical protein